MKKTTKKLTLNRETVRDLEIQPFNLSVAAGGGNSNGGTTCNVAQTCGPDVTG